MYLEFRQISNMDCFAQIVNGRLLFLQNAPCQMFNRVLNTNLHNQLFSQLRIVKEPFILNFEFVASQMTYGKQNPLIIFNKKVQRTTTKIRVE